SRMAERAQKNPQIGERAQGTVQNSVSFLYHVQKGMTYGDSYISFNGEKKVRGLLYGQPERSFYTPR
ncbi:MAG: hypothetical protein WD180_12850, partial [Pseudohongiellaceae bacterium]